MIKVENKIKTKPIRFERFNTCQAYSCMCFCYNRQEAIQCSLGLIKPIDFQENRVPAAGFCPISQSLN